MRAKESFFYKSKYIVYKMSLVILLGMFLYVFVCAMVEYGSMPFLEHVFSPEHTLGRVRRAVFLTLAGVVLAELLFLARRVVESRNERTVRIVMATLLLLLFAVQIVFLLRMRVRLRYDSLKVLDEAISICKTGGVSAEHFDGYFARYTNNYPLLFLTVAFMKAGRAMGLLTESYGGADILVGIVNILAIDMAILLLTRLLDRLYGAHNAMLAFLCMALNPLTVVWVPFYYTNTMAMPFQALILYLFHKLFCGEETAGAEPGGRQRLRACILGLCMVLGVKLRATTILTILACLLYLAVKPGTEHGSGRQERRCRTIRRLRGAGVMLAGMLVMLLAYRITEKALVPFDYKDTEFPAIHWINMGAGGNGMYNMRDEYDTIGYPTREEKKAANWESYVERVRDLGAAGYVRLLFDKLKSTFADAGAGYRAELGVSDRYRKEHLYLLGDKSDGIGFLMQLIYILSLLGLLGCILLLLFGMRRTEKNRTFILVFLYNIAGGFCFHMLWEAGNIYSLSFALLFPAGVTGVAALVQDALKEKDPAAEDAGEQGAMRQEKQQPAPDGVENGKPSPRQSKPRPDRRTVFRIGLACAMLFVCLCAAGIGSLHSYLVEESWHTNEPIVNQYIYEWDDRDELTDGEEWVQSFYADRSFTQLAFQVRNTLYDRNDAWYRIELESPDGRLMQAFDVQSGNYGDYDVVRVELENDGREAMTGSYRLRIRKTAGSADCNMVFLSYKTGNYDAYSYGSLETGSAMQDLSFGVYDIYDAPYMTRRQFFLLSAFSLCAIIVIQICLLRCLLADRTQ